MHGVSVVMCCHNSSQRIGPTLACLAAQSASFDWEVVVVDNNSTDDLQTAVQQHWPPTHRARLTIVSESRPGLKFAREKGVASSRFDYILFCDDDNHLAPDYLSLVSDRFEGNSRVGMIGGLGTAKSDSPLPAWFEQFHQMYATGRPVNEQGPLAPGVGYVYGAGMAIRRNAWDALNNIGFKSASTDRKGKELSGGHDVELSHAFRLIGFQVVFDPTLRFDHVMDSGRLQWSYALRLAAGSARNFVPIVYFLHLHRGVNGLPKFIFLYLKRVFSDLLASIQWKLGRSGDSRERELMLTMTSASWSYLLARLGSAVSYFTMVRKLGEQTRS